MTHIDAETRLAFYEALDRFMKRYGADTSRALQDEYRRLTNFISRPVVDNEIDAEKGERIVVFYEFKESFSYGWCMNGPTTTGSNHDSFEYYDRIQNYADEFLAKIEDCQYSPEIRYELDYRLQDILESLEVGQSYTYIFDPQDSSLRYYSFRATFTKKNLTPPDLGRKELAQRKRERMATIRDELIATAMSPERLARLGKDTFLGNLG